MVILFNDFSGVLVAPVQSKFITQVAQGAEDFQPTCNQAFHYRDNTGLNGIVCQHQIEAVINVIIEQALTVFLRTPS